MPSREIRTSRPGNIDWMPKYVSAAARSCRSSALYSFRARLAAASQDPPLRSVGPFGASSGALLSVVCDLAIGDHPPSLVGVVLDTARRMLSDGCRLRCRGLPVPDPGRRAPSWQSHP